MCRPTSQLGCASVSGRCWRDWFGALGNGAVAMIWRDGSADGGLALRYLGDPPKEICEADGVLLVRRVQDTDAGSC